MSFLIEVLSTVSATTFNHSSNKSSLLLNLFTLITAKKKFEKWGFDFNLLDNILLEIWIIFSFSFTDKASDVFENCLKIDFDWLLSLEFINEFSSVR